jgi:hypothetical protein
VLRGVEFCFVDFAIRGPEFGLRLQVFEMSRTVTDFAVLAGQLAIYACVQKGPGTLAGNQTAYFRFSPFLIDRKN